MFGRYYMLVRRGNPQRLVVALNQRDYSAWPIAQTHGDAKRLIAWMGDDELRPAMIGSIQGESFEQQILLAVEDGCEIICMIDGWTSDGTPTWNTLPLVEFEETTAHKKASWFHFKSLQRIWA